MAESEATEVETQTDETQTDETQTDGTQTEELQAKEGAELEAKTVPYERFQEMDAKFKGLEDQNALLQQQIALSKANSVKQAPASQFDIYKEVGAEDDDDVLTVGQQKKVLEHYATTFDSRLARLAFDQSHSDFDEIVGTVDEIAAGKFAEPLALALKDNPALINVISASANPRLAAYEIAKIKSQKAQKETVKTDEAQSAIEEAVTNAKKVKSVSNVKGGSGLSEKGRYETMADKDFIELARKNGAII